MTQFKIPLSPQPYSGTTKFIQIPDPWHLDAFDGIPVGNVILTDMLRPGGVEIATGPRQMVWAAEDWCGNIIGTMNQPPPHPNAIIEHDENYVWYWVWEDGPNAEIS